MLKKFICGSFLFLATITVSSLPTAAQTQTPQDALVCPEMSDSIHRLYLGFFLRSPEVEARRYWNQVYSSGQANLAEIAEYMTQSEEFIKRYGHLNDKQFITRIYLNVLKREPDKEGFDHWVAALADGYPRGSVMAAFSESYEFVSRTNTAIPLAGYLRWYPKGTRWYCGQGQQNVEVQLNSSDVYTDYIFTNRSGKDDTIAAHIFDKKKNQRINLASAVLSPEFALYRWDGIFSGKRMYTNTLHVEALQQTQWLFVFYQEPLGKTRLGWGTGEESPFSLA